MTSSSLRPANRQFAIYLGSFVTVWALYVLFVYGHIRALGEGSFSYVAAGIGVRLIVWMLPVFLMLRASGSSEPLRALGMVEHWKRGVLIGLALATLLFFGELIRLGWPHDVARYVTWNNILGPSLGVGFFEEIPFRGFILQKLQTRMSFWLANGIASILFVCMHLPGWFTLHVFRPELPLKVFVFSILMGAVFRYSHSLWGCIIGHNANDFISVVLFHGQ